MMLTERVAVTDAALPVQAFRDHLRLGTGFAGPGEEEAALAGFLRAAIAAIEGRTAKALVAREFRLGLGFWRDPAGQPLPLAPVSAVAAVRLLDGMGNANDLPQGLYRLVQDSVRPRLVAVGGMLPDPVSGGSVEIDFTAGFGPVWEDVPADLRQAVLLLAAQYYEMRHDGDADGAAMPFGVAALIERWRTVRLLGGRG